MAEVSVLCVTWNMNNLKKIHASFGPMIRSGCGGGGATCDICVFGAQECSIDRDEWHAKISAALGPEFELVHLQELMPIKICAFARSSIKKHIERVESVRHVVTPAFLLQCTVVDFIFATKLG